MQSPLSSNVHNFKGGRGERLNYLLLRFNCYSISKVCVGVLEAAGGACALEAAGGACALEAAGGACALEAAGEAVKGLKRHNQAKIIKKSVILFWVLTMTICCKHVHRLEQQQFFCMSEIINLDFRLYISLNW